MIFKILPENPFFLGLKKNMDHNSRNRISFFAVLLFVCFFSTRVHSIRFDLQSGHTKCISEEIQSNAMTVGKYHIVNPSEGNPLPDSHKITVRVKLSNLIFPGFCFCLLFYTSDLHASAPLFLGFFSLGEFLLSFLSSMICCWSSL